MICIFYDTQSLQLHSHFGPSACFAHFGPLAHVQRSAWEDHAACEFISYGSQVGMMSCYAPWQKHEPWQNLSEFDMLFNIWKLDPDAEQDTPANARAALLRKDVPPLWSGVGKLFVGSCDSALHWAGQHVGYIVNCTDVSYRWHPFCVRFWLNQDSTNTFDGSAWEQRMMTTVKLKKTTMKNIIGKANF